MKTILLSLFCFIGFTAFSQNAKASVQQGISFKLMDLTIVEKKPAMAITTAMPASEAAVQVRSGSQWMINTKEANKRDELIAGEENVNNIPEDDSAAIVYTVSKL